LEFYGAHRHEVAVLSNKNALFLLRFVAESENTNARTLSIELGRTQGEIENFLSVLTRAEMVNVSSRSLRVTALGRQFLEVLGLFSVLRDTIQPAPPRQIWPFSEQLQLRVRTALTALSSLDRFLLERHYVEGYTDNDFAHLIEGDFGLLVSPAWVSLHVKRAEHALLVELRKRGGDHLDDPDS
jgi:hypothetical protein